MPDAQDKTTNFERTKELTDRLEAGMKDLFQSDKYKDYLKSMSHFHNYSSRNIALINMQMPGATKVASFKLWDEQFNRHVKKGEHGIRIFAPIAVKSNETKLMEKLDPETKAPLLDASGKPIMEEMTLLTNTPRFKLVPVFDVAQTYGDPLPELVENLTGNVEHYGAFLDSLKAVSPVPVVFEPMPENKDGYCRYGEQIGIREGMSEKQTITAIVHELTHARLHDKGLMVDTADLPTFVKEVQAESVAYVVCQHYGIETAPNSFGYLAEWGGKDMAGVKTSLDTIRKESNNLINAIDDHFKIICQERGIDLTAKESENPATAPEIPLEPSYTTETRTENIAGVDFTFEDVIPQTPAAEQEAAKEPPSLIEPTESMPDPAIGESERDSYGYTYDGILPLLKERALELYDQDQPVYLLYSDNTEAMAFDRSEIETHDGIFGIDRDEWRRLSEYTALTAKNAEAAKESELINGSADTFAIYQLKDGEELRYHRFASINQLEKDNLAVDRGNYNLIYSAPLLPNDTLDEIYEKFNNNHPKDFTGHSLSVSDVVVMQRGGEVTSHYVDNAGFAELPAFLGNEKQPEVAAAPSQEEKPMAEPVVQKKLSEMLGLDLEDSKTPPLSNADNPVPIPKTVYKNTLPYAREHGEMDKYNESRNLNTECRDAIDAAISQSRYDTNHYNLRDAAKTVVAEYGAERVHMIMAKIVQGADWDGRYSRQNKEWAKGFEIPHGMKDVYSNTHPCLIDGFIERMREKPSILAALNQGGEKSRPQSEQKQEAKKSKEMEM